MVPVLFFITFLSPQEQAGSDSHLSMRIRVAFFNADLDPKHWFPVAIYAQPSPSVPRP